MDKELDKEEIIREAVEEAKRAAERASAEQETSGVSVEDSPGEPEKTEEACETEAEEAICEEESQEEGEKKARKFGRKPKKDKKDEKIDELTDKLTRQMAEFDNYRKRTEKEKSQMYEIGAKDVIEKMLLVLDNFERGLQAVPEENREDPFVEGMDKIYKQFLTTLEEIGVKPIETEGAQFNPDLHNAVMHVEDDNLGENMIAEEFQKGYIYRETVVRHSMVKVAN